jgi:uncharacterized protein YqgC (DUF456 family)
MTWTLGLVAIVLVQLAALCMIPLGLPGTWLQVFAAGIVAWRMDRPLWGFAIVLALAVAGEIAETLSGQWGARRFGGSRRAAWGALIGGFAGLFIGTPIPVLGSLAMSFVGTFAGALAGEMMERGRLAPELRVGVGAMVGRAVGIGMKLGTAFVIAVLSFGSFFGWFAGGGAS